MCELLEECGMGAAEEWRDAEGLWGGTEWMAEDEAADGGSGEGCLRDEACDFCSGVLLWGLLRLARGLRDCLVS